MIYKYVVTLRNDKARVINLISLLVAVLSVIIFTRLQIKAGTASLLYGTSAVLITICLLYIYFRRNIRYRIMSYSHILMAAGLTWFAVPGLVAWIGLPVLVLALLERPAKLPLEIGFTDDRIVINNLFKKRFHWNDFHNIILKDGLLTLDFKNNKLIQRETLDDDEDDASEDEFNAYCKLRLREK